MSFFNKLKNRLFKSSSKLEQGLDEIVEDGGEEEQIEATPAVDEAPIVEAPEPEPEPEPELAPAPEVPVEVTTEPAPVVETTPLETVEPAPVDEVIETAAVNVPKALPKTVPDAIKEVAAPLVENVKVEAPTNAVAEPEAETKKTGLIGRLLGRKEPDPVETKPTPAKVPAEKPAKKTAQKTAQKTAKKTVVKRALDDDMLERIEELLITADMGVDTALRVTANMAEGRFGKKLSTAEIKQLLAAEITRIMEPVANPLPIYAKKPQVVLVVGVNGSGKTTTIGKLASQFKAAGKDVVIAAGDTFRAAAVEQLQVWGTRAGVPVLTAAEGSDPASLAFDAMTQAEADGADLLLIDTAGRLHNRADLMEELSKIVRVIQKKDPTAPHNTLLVLDATTGQNALNQVKVFQELSNVSGLVMTKLDGTAKGGVLVALADKFGLPIHAIGVGEQIDDLDAFDPEEFAHALTGLEE